MATKKPTLELTEEDRKILDEIKFWTRFMRYAGIGLLGAIGYISMHISKEFVVVFLKELAK